VALHYFKYEWLRGQQHDPFVIPNVLRGSPGLLTLPPNDTTRVRLGPGDAAARIFANFDPVAGTGGNRLESATIRPRNPGPAGGGFDTLVDHPAANSAPTKSSVRTRGIGQPGGGFNTVVDHPPNKSDSVRKGEDAAKQLQSTAAPTGRGGFNTSTSTSTPTGGKGSNSAMDNLGNLNTGGGLGGVAGNSGGLSDTRPRAVPGPAEQVAKRPGEGGINIMKGQGGTNTGGTGGVSTVKSQSGTNTGGGTGGFSTVKSQSGTNTGGTGGFNTVKSQSGANTGAIVGAGGLNVVKKLKVNPVAPSNSPTDYGGCPGCGHNSGGTPVK
jgi:hypothetical protein